ncbi:oligopeptide transport system ATP-binding protein [Nakamurella panacisegetis]|uniref:Oligopeptide transport system ATP-binding protein n=1 Tax=Nakamurella panacisegetis TaxID=1090615 RepID=A0A1H0RAH0_9ACTN|nr:oligopeptide transport system ATP-binding protein [Nakamurella panacisegetis]
MGGVDNSDPAVEPALTVRGLSVDFGSGESRLRAVREVDLIVQRGELVALLGESGSGKSVTARAVMGLTAPGQTVRASEMRLGGTDLLRASARARRSLRGQRMSLVMQDALSALNPVLSIGDQLGELFRVHEHSSRRSARRRAVELLSAVGISDPDRRVDEYPHQFSGGMRQRILIAMAIALQPDLLIADEPTTALDVTVQAQILELLDRLRVEFGMGVLLITHDLGVVSEVADRLAVMYAGRIVETGPAAEVLDRPRHPYTQALLRSVPQAGDRGRELLTIPGSPPSPAQVPVGCAFHPRCTMAIERCRQERPLLADSEPGRTSACHRSEELADVAAH